MFSSLEMFGSSLNILSPALLGDEGKGRGVIMRDPPTKCNCERPKRNVLCNVCGLMIVGRIRIHCPKHRNVSVCYINSNFSDLANFGCFNIISKFFL